MTLTTLDLAFLLAMLFAYTYCQSPSGEVRTREALAQCSAEVETLAGVCEGRR